MSRRVRVEVGGRPVWGVRDGDSIALDDGRRLLEADAAYLAPATPSKIIAVHLTYRSRIEEYRARTPAEPSYFMKPPSTLNGHHGVIRKPRGSRYLNYEGELAAVVGRRMKGVPVEGSLDHLAGFCCANDVGLHDFRHADRGSMLRVKGQDGFLPLGPELVPARRVGSVPLHAAHVRQRRDRPGGDGQDDVIWPVEYQLADLCRLITLEPGDVVLTGTPANSRPMEAGDVVEVEISGLGRLSNTVVDWDVDLVGARRADGGLREHAARRARPPGGRGRAPRGRRRGSNRDPPAPDRPCLPARRRPRTRPLPAGRLQFGLLERSREGGRALLACNDEPYCLELVAGRRAGPRPRRLRARTRLLPRRRTRPPRSHGRSLGGARGLPVRAGSRRARGRSSCPTESRPPRSTAGRSMPGHRTTVHLGGARKLGHVNCLTGAIHECAAFYRDVLGMQLSDWLDDGGVWFHINSDHHVDGARRQGLRALPPPRLRDRRHREDARHARPPRPARPLARLGPDASRHRRQHRELRPHRRGGVLRRAVLRHGAAPGRPRPARLSRTTATRPTPGARCHPARTSASTRRRSSTSVRASRRSASPSLRSRSSSEGTWPPPRPDPTVLARTGKQYLDELGRDEREVWLDGELIRNPLEHPSARDRCGVDRPRLRSPARARRRDARCRRPTTVALVNVTHLIPRAKEDLERRRARDRAHRLGATAGLMGRTPDYLNVTFACFAGRADVWARRGNEQGAENIVAYQKDDARPRSLDDAHDHQPAGRPLEARGRAGRRRGRAAQGRRVERGDRRARRPDARDARALRRRAEPSIRARTSGPRTATTRSPSRSRWERPGSSSSAGTRSRRAAATSTTRSRRASTRWTPSRSSTTSSCRGIASSSAETRSGYSEVITDTGWRGPHHAPGVHPRPHEAPVRVRARPPDGEHDRCRPLRPHPGEARADLEHGRADPLGDRGRRGGLGARRGRRLVSGRPPVSRAARRDAEMDAARERAAAADRRQAASCARRPRPT